MAFPCQVWGKGKEKGAVADMYRDSQTDRHIAETMHDLPWDLRGPLPANPAVTRSAESSDAYKGQKWRAGSQRHANPGGVNNDRWKMWAYYQKDYYFHPKNDEGLGSMSFIYIYIYMYMGFSGVHRFQPEQETDEETRMEKTFPSNLLS